MLHSLHMQKSSLQVREKNYSDLNLLISHELLFPYVIQHLEICHPCVERVALCQSMIFFPSNPHC